jgi:hypothetical protein
MGVVCTQAIFLLFLHNFNCQVNNHKFEKGFSVEITVQLDIHAQFLGSKSN